VTSTQKVRGVVTVLGKDWTAKATQRVRGAVAVRGKVWTAKATQKVRGVVAIRGMEQIKGLKTLKSMQATSPLSED
jgi:membrane protein implicated in regulation of membrane protease activity